MYIYVLFRMKSATADIYGGGKAAVTERNNQMSRFENKLCPICRAPFTNDADIVVCPICGTPHHRSCYLAKGHCGVEEYHAQGFSWDGYLPDEQKPEKPVNTDPHIAEYPEGTPAGENSEIGGNDDIEHQMEREMRSAEEYYNNFFKSMQDETRGADGVSMKELTTFAATSTMHYGRAFSIFRNRSAGRRIYVSVNLCSGLFSPIFQFYRKMDWLGILSILLTLITSAPTLLVYAGIITASSVPVWFNNVYMLCSFLNFAATVALCLFGDYLYYRHAVKKILKIRAKFGDNLGQEYYEALADSGHPSWLRAIIGFLITAIAAALLVLLPNLMAQ